MNDLDFDEYDSFVAISGASDSPVRDQVLYAALKLNGEAGEVAEVIGKAMRVSNSKYAEVTEESRAKLSLELGDVLWYIAKLARLYGTSLRDIATLNRMKLVRREKSGKDHDVELRIAAAYLGEPNV